MIGIGKKSILDTLQRTESDNVFLDMGVGCGKYLFGRKRNGEVSIQLFNYEDKDAVTQFCKDCCHVREVKPVQHTSASQVSLQDIKRELDELKKDVKEILSRLSSRESGV